MEDILKIKLFIPSKNRLDKPLTYNILKELGLNPIFVLEPQEENQANILGYNYILLDKNDQGITYARNFILNYCRENNIEYAVMMDDDIGFFKRFYVDGTRKKDNTVFIDALKAFYKMKNTGTMQYEQFGWCAKENITYNKSIEVVHFLYIPQLKKIKYEENTIEDKDFALQLIFAGIKPFMLKRLTFHVPAIGTNKGGLFEHYATGKHITWAKNLLNKWGPEIIKIIVEKNGHVNVKVNWQKAIKLANATYYQQKLY